MTAPLPPWALPRMPLRPWMETRTAHPPGIAPLDPAEWLLSDATHGAQMALRDGLVSARPGDVTACLPEGAAAAVELRDLLAAEVTARHGAQAEGGALRRADGASVSLDGPPMQAVARLAQEDFLLLHRPEGAAEHVLVAGALCFPADWVLAEKMGKPLLRIHKPVAEYDARLAARVQRLHDGLKPGRPLWRANWNFSDAPELFHPVAEARKMARRAERAAPGDWRAAWIRVERQTLLRLPRSGAVAFGVRTLLAPLSGCSAEDWAGFHRAFQELAPEHRAAKVGAEILAEAARRAGG